MDEKQFRKLSDELVNRLEGVVERGLDNALCIAFGESVGQRVLLGQLFAVLMNGSDNPQEFIKDHFRAAAQSLENTAIHGEGLTTENQIEATRRHAANVLEEFFVDLAVAAHQARNGGAGEANP